MATRQTTVSTRAALDGNKIEKARREGKYISVPSGRDAVLGGAFAKWKKPETFEYVYIPDLRLAGMPLDLVAAITTLRDENNIPYSAQDANAFISTGYTKYNTTVPEAQGGKMEQFEEELDALAAGRQQRTTVRREPEVTLADLTAILTSIKGKTGVKPVRGPRQGSPGTATTGRGRILPLATRLEKLTPGKVLDVSNMKPDGKDIRAIAVPGPTSQKIGVDLQNYPIVSSNLANYATAVRALYPNAEDLINAYNQRLAQTNAPVARPRTVTTTVNVPRQPIAQQPIPQVPQAIQPIQPVQPIQPMQGFAGIQPRVNIPQAGAVGAPRITAPGLTQYRAAIPQVGSD